MKLRHRCLLFGMIAAAGAVGFAFSGCSSSNNNTPTNVKDASNDNNTIDSGITFSNINGGLATVRSLMQAAVTTIASDPNLESYFYYQLTPDAGVGVQPTPPSVTNIEDCLTILAVQQLGGPVSYLENSTTVDGPDAAFWPDAGSVPYTCRDMLSIHANLGITQTDLANFLADFASTVTQNVGTSAVTGNFTAAQLQAWIDTTLTNYATNNESSIVRSDAGGAGCYEMGASLVDSGPCYPDSGTSDSGSDSGGDDSGSDAGDGE